MCLQPAKQTHKISFSRRSGRPAADEERSIQASKGDRADQAAGALVPHLAATEWLSVERGEEQKEKEVKSSEETTGQDAGTLITPTNSLSVESGSAEGSAPHAHTHTHTSRAVRRDLWRRATRREKRLVVASFEQRKMLRHVRKAQLLWP